MVSNFKDVMGENPKVVEFKVLEEHPDGTPKVMYSHSKLGFLMSDRDSLLHFEIQDLDDDRKLVIMKSIERDDIPMKQGVIRIEMYKAAAIKRDGSDLRIENYSNFTMKGMIPARLMNMMMQSNVSRQMKNVYNRMKES